MTTPQTDLDVALAAARSGAEVLNRTFGSDLTREHKSATDFATAADRAAERAILEVIHAARPDDGFEGEELGAVHAGTRRRTWLVDPLCGTVNFAAESPSFCVNVALVDEGTAQLAADPELRATFNPRIESTTLALAWVAGGQRLAYVTDGMCEGSVHFTAGIALCKAAGCVVTDLDGEPVHTGPGIVAARGRRVPRDAPRSGRTAPLGRGPLVPSTSRPRASRPRRS